MGGLPKDVTLELRLKWQDCAMAHSGDSYSRQRKQLLQRFWGKNEFDMFKDSREIQCG